VKRFRRQLLLLLLALERLWFVLVLIGGIGIPIVIYLTLFNLMALPDWTWNGGRDSIPGILIYIVGWGATFVALVLALFVKNILMRPRI
jgi:hypothetical protein